MNNEVKSGLSGTKTEQNMRDALAGEALTHTRYMIFADEAHKNGDHVLAKQFEETADNEKEHARIWMEYLGDISDDLGNVLACEAGEEYESTTMYPEYASVADDEGFAEIAEKFRQVGSVEKTHGENFAMTARDLENGDRYEGSENTVWECGNCGYRVTGMNAPDRCPLCSHRKGEFSKA